MSDDRLGFQFPAVAKALASVPRDSVMAVARRLATAAAHECGVLPKCQESSDLAEVADAFDELAWQARDAEEAGEPLAVSYDEAFRKARAASAYSAAFASGNAEEATYEAVHALGGDPAAEDRAVALISGR